MSTTLLVLARALQIGSAMLLITLPFFTAFILRPAWTENHPNRDESFCRRMGVLLWAALIVEALSGAAWLWLVAAEMSAKSPWGGLTLADTKTVLFQTSFGQLWIGRGMVLVILALLLCWLGRGGLLHRPRTHPGTLLHLVLSGVLLASLAWAGHAGSGARWHFWHLFVDLVHLGAGAIWPLGLLPFALFLKRALHEAGGIADRDVAVVRRFSHTSLATVLILIGSGVANSWLMLPSWNALFTTAFGWMLLGKVLVVAVMVSIGAFNRWQLLPTLSQGGALRLVRSVVVESILAFLVLLIVGLMGITPPGS